MVRFKMQGVRAYRVHLIPEIHATEKSELIHGIRLPLLQSFLHLRLESLGHGVDHLGQLVGFLLRELG
jgi:hypothetical protein